MRPRLSFSVAATSARSASMRLMSRRMRSWLIRILSGLVLRPAAGLAVKALCGRAISVTPSWEVTCAGRNLVALGWSNLLAGERRPVAAFSAMTCAIQRPRNQRLPLRCALSVGVASSSKSSSLPQTAASFFDAQRRPTGRLRAPLIRLIFLVGRSPSRRQFASGGTRSLSENVCSRWCRNVLDRTFLVCAS